MFSRFVLFIGFLFTFNISLKADYTLNFKSSDLYRLKQIVYSSECDTCTFPMKRKVIETFIRYGHQNGFNGNTQFGKVYKINEKNACLEIAFDPILLNRSPNIPLVIRVFAQKKSFSLSPDLHFTLSPEMNDLIKELIKENATDKKKRP